MPITFTGLPPGGWFGEGTVLKREPTATTSRRCAQRGGRHPVATFHWLLDRSIGFNRFVMNQLNERLGQFIAAREIDRLTHPDERVARSLAALFHPVLYPGVGSCCASRSRSWATWWACRASASTRRCSALQAAADPHRIRRRARARPPTTTVNVTYRVGSRHENYGETGMAHLLEHLIFKGTPTPPPTSGRSSTSAASAPMAAPGTTAPTTSPALPPTTTT
jgi:hypothetical protein